MTITLPWARRLTATALTVVTAACAALTAAAPVAAVPTAVATTAITERGHQAEHPIFLVTGEQVLAGAAGVSVLGAPGGSAGQLVKLSMGGETYVMPVTAASYLGHVLDPSLFQLAALARAEAGGRLPVRVRYSGPAPVLPGLTVTSAGAGTMRGT